MWIISSATIQKFHALCTLNGNLITSFRHTASRFLEQSINSKYFHYEKALTSPCIQLPKDLLLPSHPLETMSWKKKIERGFCSCQPIFGLLLVLCYFRLSCMIYFVWFMHRKLRAEANRKSESFQDFKDTNTYQHSACNIACMFYMQGAAITYSPNNSSSFRANFQGIESETRQRWLHLTFPSNSSLFLPRIRSHPSSLRDLRSSGRQPSFRRRRSWKGVPQEAYRESYTRWPTDYKSFLWHSTRISYFVSSDL